jgi:integrase
MVTEFPIKSRQDAASLIAGAKLATSERLLNDSLTAYAFAQEANRLYAPEDLIASGTWQKYEVRAAALAYKSPRDNPYEAFLRIDRAGGWETVNTRQAYRSALVRLAAQLVIEGAPSFWKHHISQKPTAKATLQFCEWLRKSGDSTLVARFVAAQRRLDKTEYDSFRSAVAFLVAHPPDPSHQELRKYKSDRSVKFRRKPNAQIESLRALNQHQDRKRKLDPTYCWLDTYWQFVLADNDTGDLKRAMIATLILTGCRPVEFSRRLGIELSIADVDAAKRLTFKIHGAKTATKKEISVEAKGQAVRQITLGCHSPEALWLHRHISRSGENRLVFSQAAAPYSLAGKMLSIAEQERLLTNSLGKRVKKIASRAFPRLKHNVTPYVFRHSFADALRTEGRFDEQARAAALGQQSTRTLGHYGGSNRRKKTNSVRSQQIVGIDASSPVREYSRSFPNDAGTNSRPRL